MADVKNLRKVKLYLSASSKRGLVDKMLQNNQRNDMMYQYSCPVFAEGQWVVWFTADAMKVKGVF